MAWQPYQTCCEESAKDSEAALCGQCGNALLRCSAYADCSQLLEPGGHCSHHVQPVLELAEDFRPAKLMESEQLSLDLRLTNLSPATRLTDITAHIRYGQSADWIRRSIPLRVLAPLDLREFSLDLGELAAGTQKAEVALDFRAQIGECKERYAFSSAVWLRVDQKDTRAIHKTIHIENSHLAAGAAGVVTTGDTIGDSPRPRMDSPTTPPVLLKGFHRDERFELEQGVRGYPGGAIEPDVDIHFRGFAPDHYTPIPRPFLLKRTLRCGRNGINAEQMSNDLRLLAIDAPSGAVNRQSSMRISRHHCDLVLQNGRLYLIAKDSTSGVWIDGKQISPVMPHMLKHGSRVELLLRLVPHPIRFQIQFQGGHQEISSIVLVREG
jgi:hypothetical protein